MRKIQISGRTLRKLYITRGLSSAQIARELGCSEWTVITRLRRAGIQVRPRGGRFTLIDLNGARFGAYTVVAEAKTKSDRHKNTYWLCRCDCGNYSEVQSAALRKGLATSCGKCTNFKNWKGVGEMSGQYFCALRSNAKRRALQFLVTKDDLWRQFLAQHKSCAVTGVPLNFVRSYGRDSSLQTASLDRINSSKGYVPGNVRWVHKAVNCMRWHMSDKELLAWAKLIVAGPLASAL